MVLDVRLDDSLASVTEALSIYQDSEAEELARYVCSSLVVHNL